MQNDLRDQYSIVSEHVTDTIRLGANANRKHFTYELQELVFSFIQNFILFY